MSEVIYLKMQEHLAAAANLLRDAVGADQQKDYIATLFFLKWLSDGARKRSSDGMLIHFWREAEGAPPVYIPRRARWEELQADRIDGAAVDDAAASLAAENPQLEGIFSGVHFDQLPRDSIKQLIWMYSELNFRNPPLADPQTAGHLFEWILREIGSGGSRQDGGLSAAPAVVDLIVKLIRPEPGMRIYDPACGTGGFLARAVQFARECQTQRPNPLPTVAGREMNTTAWARCRMNMMIQQIPQARILHGNALSMHSSPSEFDRVLSFPPWGTKWPGSHLNSSMQFEFGIPPATHGEYAWIQHAFSALAPGGVAAILLPQGVLFRGGKEARIRERMVRKGVLEALILLSNSALVGVSVPAVVMILRRPLGEVRTPSVFLLDAGRMDWSGAAPESPEVQMEEIARRYHSKDQVPGESRAISLDDIEANDFVLSPPLYLRPEHHLEPLRINDSLSRIANLERQRQDLASEIDLMLRGLADHY